MKKVLKKKIKNTSNAVRYFSTETLTKSMLIGDTSCYLIVGTKNCPC